MLFTLFILYSSPVLKSWFTTISAGILKTETAVAILINMIVENLKPCFQVEILSLEKTDHTHIIISNWEFVAR